MPGIEEKLLAMKRKLDSLTQRRDRAVWQREQTEKELKELCGHSDASKAIKEAEKLEKQAAQYQKKAEEGLAKLLEIHKDLLEMGQ